MDKETYMNSKDIRTLRARHFAEGCALFTLCLLVFALLYTQGISVTLSSSIAVGVATAVCIISIILRRTGMSVGCIGAIIFLAIFISFSLEPTLSLSGSRGDFVLRAKGEAQSYSSYGAVDCTLLSLDGKPVKSADVRLILLDGSPEEIMPGDRIEVRGKLSTSSSQNRLSQGTLLTLKQTGDYKVTARAEETVFSRLRTFSLKLADKIRATVKGDEGALLAALLCGDREGFTPKYTASLRASGLSHIAAVSGMHISILLAFVMLILPKRGAIIVSIPLVLCFGAMTSFSPSITRALIMSSMLGVAFLIKAEYDALTALFTAGAIIGALNPFALCSASFLLSFFSTLGIILFSPKIMGAFSGKLPRNRLLMRLCHWLISALSVTLSATLFTLPLQMIFFPSVSLNFLLSNLLAVWAVAPAMFIAILLLPAAFFVPMVKDAAIFIISLLPKYINSIIYLMGDKLRLTASSDNIWLVMTAVCIFVCALVLYFKKISPALFASVSATAIILSTLFVLCFSSPEILVWGEGGDVCIAVSNRGDLLSIGAPSNYNGAYFAQAQLEKGRNQTVLLLSDEYSHWGGLEPSLADEVYTPTAIDGVDFKIYTQSGKLDFDGFSAEVTVLEGGISAVRIVTDKLSVTDLSAASPYTPLPDMPKTDILVLSADYTKAPRMLSSLCARLTPAIVLISGSADASHTQLEELCGCKVILLDDAGQVKIK